MKLLIQNKKTEEWEQVEVSFWNLFKFYFLLDLARLGMIILVFFTVAILFGMLGLLY